MANNPHMWIPPPEKANNECTFPELWSRHCYCIADFRHFKDPETRLADYTQVLKTISAGLSKAPACRLSAFDILQAITSVRTYSAGGLTRLYSDDIYKKRLAVIRDAYKYFEAYGICSNPLWHPPWELVGDGHLDAWMTPNDLLQEMAEVASSLSAKRLLPRFLLDDMEDRLMRRVMANITKDGRWAGIALLLYQGPRMSEARGLCYADLVPLVSRPERRKIIYHCGADAQGQKKSTLKNRQSVRANPEHIELMSILRRREDYTKAELGKEGIGNLPVVCYENNFTQPCSSADFASFLRKQLDTLFVSDPEAKRALLIDLYLNDDPTLSGDDQTDPADLELAGRLFRRHFATQCNAKTSMSDDDIAVAMGHKLTDDVSFLYSERNIMRLMDMLDHRMIIPELHPGWDITLHPDDDVKVVDCGTIFFTFDPSIYGQGGTIEIISQSVLPGDAIIMETNRKLPANVTVEFDPIYTPSLPKRSRANTDTLHQPLPEWPPKKGDENK